MKPVISNYLRNSQQDSNHYQSNQQQYEEEFWKLKAQRLESKNDELSKSIQGLTKKLIDAQAKQNQLLQKKRVFQLMSNSKDKQNLEKLHFLAKQEIQRLGKQMKILKNVQSVEAQKMTEQIKKLKKQIDQFQARQKSWISLQQHKNAIKCLTDEVGTLTRRIQSHQQLISRSKIEKKKLIEDNEDLRKQIQILQTKIAAAHKQEQENLIEKTNYNNFIYQYNGAQNSQSPIYMEKNRMVIIQSVSDLQKIIYEKDQTINTEKEKQLSKYILQKAQWNNERAKLQNKCKQIQFELNESKTELKNVLIKLSPLLLEREHKEKQRYETKASLTLLQIFLKKYKIQSF